MQLTGRLAELLALPDEGVAADADTSGTADAESPYATRRCATHFAEVTVDTVTGEVRVTRLLGVFAAERILNARPGPLAVHRGHDDGPGHGADRGQHGGLRVRRLRRVRPSASYPRASARRRGGGGGALGRRGGRPPQPHGAARGSGRSRHRRLDTAIGNAVPPRHGHPLPGTAAHPQDRVLTDITPNTEAPAWARWARERGM
ncbi:hypothetical protein LV779_25990 [Streptomyces thinghirensis]|nr:hypothetical protein [Streptomyces thinghirensis]